MSYVVDDRRRRCRRPRNVSAKMIKKDTRSRSQSRHSQ